VVATDISPKMVREIKKQGIESKACDAEKLPFADNFFDSVVAAEVIYYLDHPESFFRESYRVLKPGGRLLISTANNTVKIYDRLRAYLRIFGIKGMYFDDKVREFMTHRRLQKLLQDRNFYKIRILRLYRKKK